VLLDALALQIRLTQGAIADALALEAPGLPQVSRVRVEEQQAVTIGQARGLRLAGRFDWRLANDPIRVDSPFELYLARGERGQSWRLARPAGAAARDIPQALPGLPSDATPAGSGVAKTSPGEGAQVDPQQAWLTYPLPLPGERGRG
jgi:hypothetical protein